MDRQNRVIPHGGRETTREHGPAGGRAAEGGGGMAMSSTLEHLGKRGWPMGGYGSGSWASWNRKITVEECEALAVGDLELSTRPAAEVTDALAALWFRYGIRATSTPCRFGGRRWLFKCGCGRRVVNVYRPPGGQRFACRHCHHLGYSSTQDEHKFDRLYAALAANMGVSPHAVKTVLSRGYSKRTVRMLNAALSGGRDLMHLRGAPNERTRTKNEQEKKP